MQISLSKSQEKVFRTFPDFFAPTLNALYGLHTEKGFNKPKLSTWREEACLEFRRGPTRVLVQYAWPAFLEVRIGREGQPRNTHFVLYKKFEGIGKDTVMQLAEPLYGYLMQVSEQIYEKTDHVK